MDIPGTPFTFGVLANAQAVGDLQALRTSGRRAIRVQAGSSPEIAIHTMTDGLT